MKNCLVKKIRDATIVAYNVLYSVYFSLKIFKKMKLSA